MSTYHHVTATWDGSGWPSVFMKCTAPSASSCHARWDCSCETFTLEHDFEGKPVHIAQEWGGDIEEEHVGEYDAEWCNLREWFSADGQELLAGTITFPVKASWEYDYYNFEIVEENL